MKVVKKGREQKGWAKEFTCTGAGNRDGGCGAVLLIEQNDVFCTYRDGVHETETFNTFRCSECGVLTDLYDVLPFPPHKKEPAQNSD